MRPSGLIADQLGDTPRSPPPRPAPSQPAGAKRKLFYVFKTFLFCQL